MSDMKRELGLHFDKEAIYRHEFKQEFKGYNKLEVDQVLDQIIKDYGLMFDEIERLRSMLVQQQPPSEFVTRYEFERLQRRVERLQEALEKKGL